MSKGQESPGSAAELERFEAQRQAFSRLMARFTADRDAMIAAVQQCNERIDGLTARLGAGEGAVAAPAPAGGGESAPDLSEIRAFTERFLAQQQGALAEVRTASDRALQRADEAMRRWRETAEQVNEKDSGGDAVRQSLEKVSERLARLEELFMAHAAEPPAMPDETPVRELSERLISVEQQLHAFEESLDGVRQEIEQPPSAADNGAAQIFDLGLRDLRDQVSHLESIAAWTPKLQRLWVSLVASAVVAGFAVVYIR